jgi:hypothetical protein
MPGLFKKSARRTPQSPAARVADVSWTPETFVPPPNFNPGWEYLYFATELARGLSLCDQRFHTLTEQEIAPKTEVRGNPVDFIKDRMNTIGALVNVIEPNFAPQRVEKAFGKPMEMGNESEIRHMAYTIVGVYSQLIDLAQDLRDRSFPSRIQAIANDVSNMVVRPLDEVRAFSAKLSVEVPELVEAVNAGRPPARPVELVLKITADPEVVAKMDADLTTLGAS